MTGTLAGIATKGPVSGATVTAYEIRNGVKGPELGRAMTNAQGDFTIAMHPYSGAVMLQEHGGSYMDEATGTRMNMMNADDVTCVVPEVTVMAGSATSGIQVTPLTSMAQVWAEHMAGGMTPANAAMANEHVDTHYLGRGADIVMTHPIDPTVSGSANGASEFAKNYGMMLGAMSQEARGLGMMTSSSGMTRAMAQDAFPLMGGADPESGAVRQGHDRDIEKIAETNEPCQLVRGVAIQRSSEDLRLVCYDAGHHAVEPSKTNDKVSSEIPVNLIKGSFIHDHVDERATKQMIEKDPVKSVEVLSKRFAVNDDEKGGVLRYLISGGDLSKYGVA